MATTFRTVAANGDFLVSFLILEAPWGVRAEIGDGRSGGWGVEGSGWPQLSIELLRTGISSVILNSGVPLGCASGDGGWAEWGMGSGGKWMPTTFHTVAANGQEKVSFQFARRRRASPSEIQQQASKIGHEGCEGGEVGGKGGSGWGWKRGGVDVHNFPLSCPERSIMM